MRGYRFEDAERRAVERVAQALRQRLSLELRLRAAPLAGAGLIAAMEAIQAPAFLVRGMNVVQTNALGRARLDAHVDETLSRGAVRDPPGAPKLIHPGAGMVIHP